MQAARRPLEAIRAGEPRAIFVLLALAAIGFAYSSLFTLGTRYGFEKGVEYWLFRPTDNAPLVIIVLSGWLFYRRLYRLQGLTHSTGPLLLIGACVTGAIGMHLWAIYTRADDLKVFSLALTLSALILAWWGRYGLRALWLPIVFLLFAIPMPAPLLLSVVFEMQIWTAEFSGFLLYLLGIPALVSGDQILRATQTFQVIEGCSGLRSVQTLTMLTILLVDLFGRRGWHAAVLVLSAPLVAFFLNGFRVLALILNPHSEIIAIHNLQGIAILLVGLLIVYGFDTLIERFAPQPPHAALPRDAAPRPFAPRVAYGALGVIAFATVAGTFWMPIWRDPDPRPFALNDLVSPALAGWQSEKLEPDFLFRGSVRFGQVVDRRYDVAGAPIYVFLGLADLGQRGGSPLSPITALPGSGWVVRESAPEALDQDGRIVEARVVEKGKQRLLVHHWFSGNRGLGSETFRSLFALDRSPLRRPEPLYVARIATPLRGRGEADRADAEARIANAYDRLAPALRSIERGASADVPRLTSLAREL